MRPESLTTSYDDGYHFPSAINFCRSSLISAFSRIEPASAELLQYDNVVYVIQDRYTESEHVTSADSMPSEDPGNGLHNADQIYATAPAMPDSGHAGLPSPHGRSIFSWCVITFLSNHKRDALPESV